MAGGESKWQLTAAAECGLQATVADQLDQIMQLSTSESELRQRKLIPLGHWVLSCAQGWRAQGRWSNLQRTSEG